MCGWERARVYNGLTPSPKSDNFVMETVGRTAVATLMEGKNLKYIVLMCILCLLPALTTSGHVPL